jgi:hypothetical protein
VYLIARGGMMREHAVRDARRQEQQFRSYVQEAAGPQSTADQLASLLILNLPLFRPPWRGSGE